MGKNNESFEMEEFINNVCNDKYVLVIGSEVILDKDKHSDVNGDIHKYILKVLSKYLGREAKPFHSLSSLVASRPSVSSGSEYSGADLIRHYLASELIDRTTIEEDSYDDEMDDDDYDDEESEEEGETNNKKVIDPPTLADISPELYQLIGTKLFRFVMTTTFDPNVELLMRLTWKDDLRVVNIANPDDWKKFQNQVADTIDRNNFAHTIYKWNRPTLIYIFGKATKNRRENFVKTENDAIEFIEKWMKMGGSEDPVIPMLKEKRILALGCKFDDWYFRFFWYILKRDFVKLGEGEVALSLDDEEPNDRKLKRYLKSKNIYLHKDARIFMKNFCEMLTPETNNAQSGYFHEIMKKHRGEGEIFLSYASSDFILASRVFLQLTSMGYNVWFDHKSLCGGNYVTEIEKAINKAKIVITLLTPDIAEDLCKGETEHFYNKEWRLASQLDSSRIIPLAANGYSLRGWYHAGGINNGTKIVTFEDIIRGHENGVDLMIDGFEKLIEVINNKKK